MRSRRFLPLGVVLFCMVPVVTEAQAARGADDTLDAVVRELRLLRQAVERQGAATARVQLLIARLGLQEQRVARARQTVERLEGEAASALREQNQMQAAARETVRSLELVTDEEQRKRLEAESQMIRNRLADLQARVSAAENRLSQAKETLDIETGRYDELDAWLRDLDRELQGGR